MGDEFDFDAFSDDEVSVDGNDDNFFGDFESDGSNSFESNDFESGDDFCSFGDEPDLATNNSADDDIFADFGGSDDTEEDNTFANDDVAEVDELEAPESEWAGEDLLVDEEDKAVFHDRVTVEQTVEEAAGNNEEEDDPFDSVWNKKTDTTGLPVVDKNFADKIKDTGEPYIAAFVEGDNLTYIAHGGVSKIEYMYKFMTRALGANVTMFPVGDVDIDKIKNDPLAFKETYKKYVEA